MKANLKIIPQDKELVHNQHNLDLIPEEIDGIFSTRVSNSLFSQLVIAEFCSSFFAMFGLFSSIIVYELKVRQFHEVLASQMAIKYNIGCTFCLIMSIYIRYDLWIDTMVQIYKCSRCSRQFANNRPHNVSHFFFFFKCGCTLSHIFHHLLP